MTVYGNNPRVAQLAEKFRRGREIRDALVAEDRKSWWLRSRMGKRRYLDDMDRQVCEVAGASEK